MKYIYIFILLNMFAFCANAQSDRNHAIDKKLKIANDLFEYGDYMSALKNYEEVLQIDSNNLQASFKSGICFFNLKIESKEAISRLQNAQSKGKWEASYYLGQLYHKEMKFDEAINEYNNYLKAKAEKEIDDKTILWLKDKSGAAKEMVKAPVKVTIEDIGPPINSPYPDYVPLINADESMMLFTSRREGSTGNRKDPYGKYFEDIYVSYREKGQWTSPKNISEINTETHDACVGLSADGTKLFVYRTTADGSSGDIYMSNYDGKQWSKPEIMNGEINTEEGWEPSACISTDDNTIYFTSNRPGGYGGRDIYRIVKLPDGNWSKAWNLGPAINTAYDEDAPFIHPDGTTLYFSSVGHHNMGGFDIFKTELDDNNYWTEPENLGYPINSVEDDIYFVMSANGKRGYYSSKQSNSIGDQDIYLLRIPSDEADVGVIKGQVINDNGTNAPLKATITLIDELTQKVQGIYRTSAKTGKYLLVAKTDKRYKMIVESEGFYSKTEYLSTEEMNADEHKMNIELTKKVK